MGSERQAPIEAALPWRSGSGTLRIDKLPAQRIGSWFVGIMIPSSVNPHRLILLAEDQPDDVFLMRLALQKAAILSPLFVARDGQEAIEYLSGEGAYANRLNYPLPHLLLLDLKMPRRSGFDVLEWLQAHPELKELPVIVLSSSNLEEDICKAKKLGAADFKVKPSDLGDLITLVREIHTRWLNGTPVSATTIHSSHPVPNPLSARINPP